MRFTLFTAQNRKMMRRTNLDDASPGNPFGLRLMMRRARAGVNI
jgi:hypothetical protein